MRVIDLEEGRWHVMAYIVFYVQVSMQIPLLLNLAKICYKQFKIWLDDTLSYEALGDGMTFL